MTNCKIRTKNFRVLLAATCAIALSGPLATASAAEKVKLKDQVEQLEARFPRGVPSLLECDRLTVRGDVQFGGDVGGRVPGSNASDSTEIYQEGLGIPPLKLTDRGVRNDAIWGLIERNVRTLLED